MSHDYGWRVRSCSSSPTAKGRATCACWDHVKQKIRSVVSWFVVGCKYIILSKKMFILFRVMPIRNVVNSIEIRSRRIVYIQYVTANTDANTITSCRCYSSRDATLSAAILSPPVSPEKILGRLLEPRSNCAVSVQCASRSQRDVTSGNSKIPRVWLHLLGLGQSLTSSKSSDKWNAQTAIISQPRSREDTGIYGVWTLVEALWCHCFLFSLLRTDNFSLDAPKAENCTSLGYRLYTSF